MRFCKQIRYQILSNGTIRCCISAGIKRDSQADSAPTSSCGLYPRLSLSDLPKARHPAAYRPLSSAEPVIGEPSAEVQSSSPNHHRNNSPPRCSSLRLSQLIREVQPVPQTDPLHPHQAYVTHRFVGVTLLPRTYFTSWAVLFVPDRPITISGRIPCLTSN